MVLGRPVVRPVGVNLETPSVRVCREAWGACQERRGGSRESRTPAGLVFVGCQQGFNKRLMAKTGGSVAGL
jgi:hypothetical protein